MVRVELLALLGLVMALSSLSGKQFWGLAY